MINKDWGPACVIDAQFVGDNADHSVSHHHKCQYYDQLKITSWVHHQMGAQEVIYSRVMLSWLGLLAGESAQCLGT